MRFVGLRTAGNTAVLRISPLSIGICIPTPGSVVPFWEKWMNSELSGKPYAVSGSADIFPFAGLCSLPFMIWVAASAGWISWRRIQPAGAGVPFCLNTGFSNRFFRQEDAQIPWIRVKSGERRFPEGRRGRYVQWRALLLGADSGRYSPLLSQVALRYSRARKLFRPAGLAAQAGDRRVVLRWTPNMDRIHGYRIYVGTKPGDYLYRNPIRVPLSAINRSRPEFVVYGLENDRLYYFAITAYDRNGIGHESRFSREVYCRPSFLAGKK